MSANMYQDEKYPILPWIAYAIRWCDGFISLLESFVMSISSLLLTIGIAISMGDFLTGGGILAQPYVFGAWATIQTLAIDSQFISMWFRAKLEFTERRRYWPARAAGYAILGSALGFVAFGANSIPSLQQALHTNFSGALAALSLSPVDMVYIRSGVVIVLAVIAAFTRTVVHFDAAGRRINPAISTQIAIAPAQKPAKIAKVKPAKTPKNKGEKVRLFGWPGRKKEAQNLPVNQPQTAPSVEQETDEKNLSKPTDEILPILPVEQNFTEEKRIEAGTVQSNQVEEMGQETLPQDDLSEKEKFAQIVPTAPEKLQMALEFLREYRDASDEDLAAHLGIDRPAAARYWRLQAERILPMANVETNEHPELTTNQVAALLNRPARPIEPAERAEPKQRDTQPLTNRDDQQANEAGASYTGQFNSSNSLGSGAVLASAHTERREYGLTAEEVINDARVIAIYPTPKRREKAVNDAISSNRLRTKTDGKIREHALRTWLKSVEPVPTK